MALGPGRPRLERKLAQPRQLARISNLDGLAPDQNAPAGASASIGPVNLERHPAAAARQVQLGPLVGAEYHHVTIDNEVDGKHDRPERINEGEPTQSFPCQQLEAL